MCSGEGSNPAKLNVALKGLREIVWHALRNQKIAYAYAPNALKLLVRIRTRYIIYIDMCVIIAYEYVCVYVVEEAAQGLPQIEACHSKAANMQPIEVTICMCRHIAVTKTVSCGKKKVAKRGFYTSIYLYLQLHIFIDFRIAYKTKW